MLWLFPLLSLACTYGMVACAYWGFRTAELTAWLTRGTLPLTGAVLVLCVVNLVCAVRAGRRAGWAEARRLSGLALAWKLLAVPYFYCNLIAWLMAASAFLVIPGLQVFLLGLPLAAAATYVPLLTSSAYSLAAIGAARRLGDPIKTRHILLELLFVLDVAAALWLYIHLRRTETEQNTEKGEQNHGSLCNGV